MSKIFPANLIRYSPYAAYRFLVYFGTSTTPVAAVSKVGAIKRETKVIEYNEGGSAITLKSPARTTYDAITLDRGITQDPDFATWANYAQVLDHGSPSSSLANLRREVAIVLLNEEAQPVIRYLVHRAWVSEYQALPELDAGGNTVAIEHIKMENEGWERDLTLAEPVEQ
jgi:phage tail-like protein